MFHSYIIQNTYPGAVTVEAFGLPANRYDFYYYGRCGAPFDYGKDFELIVGGVSQGHRSPGGGDVNSTNWIENVHYVSFRNVQVGLGQSAKISMTDISGVCGANLSGMQIIPSLNSPPAPSFWSQPQNLIVPPGSNFTFAVLIKSFLPAVYQWYKDGSPLLDDSHVSGATSTNLTISSALLADTGNYWLLASNLSGTSTSSVAMVFVGVTPTIATNPLSVTSVVGSNVTFTVVVTGTPPPSYQWRFKGANLTNEIRITGVGSASLSIQNIRTNDAGAYTVVVTNGGGSATSAPAALTVIVPPSFTVQPTNKTVLGGSNFSLSVSATGTSPLRYQWVKNGTNLSGAIAPSLFISNAKRTNAASYFVIVTNLGGSATSSTALLKVHVRQRLTQSLLSGGQFVLSSQDSDGGLLSPSDLLSFVLLSSSNLSTWQVVSNGLNFTNGTLEFVDPSAPTNAARFYQIYESW